MQSYTLKFPSGATEYLFEAGLDRLRALARPERTVIITDERVAELHGAAFTDYRLLTIPAGEASKSWKTIEHLAEQLIALQADRQTLLLGLGGGVVTDITGFLAGIYMRGIACAFVPTTLLAMVDAAIGGKNGVNLSAHKNMLGLIRQPSFILYHTDFLLTLPPEEWSNGFAEIIKYGYIADTRILTTLQQGDIPYFQKHPQQLSELIEGCANIKNKIVLADETETGLRRMLNFGHTAGHAFEMLYQLPHGYAVGLGMLLAVQLSTRYKGLAPQTLQQLTGLLEKYGLPAKIDYDPQQVLDVIRMDKKKSDDSIHYILLEKPGVAIAYKLTIDQLAAHWKETA